MSCSSWVYTSTIETNCCSIIIVSIFLSPDRNLCISSSVEIGLHCSYNSLTKKHENSILWTRIRLGKETFIIQGVYTGFHLTPPIIHLTQSQSKALWQRKQFFPCHHSKEGNQESKQVDRQKRMSGKQLSGLSHVFQDDRHYM